MSQSVIFNLVQGEVLIAGTMAVSVSEAGSHGELQIGGGSIIRPLTFGERTRIVERSAVNVSALCQGILHTAQVKSGADSSQILEILALALAGGDEDEAPSFAESVLRVAGAAGWSFAQIYEAEAAEIDRLAVYIGGRAEFPQDDGWNRIVFPSNPSANDSGGDVLEGVRHTLANRLLSRADLNCNPNVGEVDTRITAVQSHINEISESQRLGSRGESLGQSMITDQYVRDLGALPPETEDRIADSTSSDGAHSISDLGHEVPSDTNTNIAPPGHETSARTYRVSGEDAIKSEYSLPSVPGQGASNNDHPLISGQSHDTVVNRPRGYIRVQTQGNSPEVSCFTPRQEKVTPAVRGMYGVSAASTALGATNWGSPRARGTSAAPNGAQESASQSARVLARSGSPAATVTAPTVAPAQTLVAGPSADAVQILSLYANRDSQDFATTRPDLPAAPGASFSVDDMADTLADILSYEADLRGLER